MKSLLVILLCCLSLNAHAHDFWLAPESYHIDKADDVKVSAKVGHPIDRSSWPSEAHRVVSFRSFGAGGISDQQATLKDFKANRYLVAKLGSPGTHMLVVETTEARSVLSAEKFEAYLEEKGLTLAKQHRKQKGATNAPGVELYSRRGKTLIQVGRLDNISDQMISRPVGQTLEIVPQENPYRLTVEAPMRLKIYYRGLPVAGVKVALISLDTIVGEVAHARSNAFGEVRFPRPPRGAWMVQAVWSSPIEDGENADYSTVFSSLSFGFE